MRVLVVAAHPDDEVLGCGGTIARLSQEGHDVHILILGEGITSRFKNRGKGPIHEVDILRTQCCEVARLLGAKRVSTRNLPDNQFDSIPLLTIVKEIESEIKTVKAECVYTQHGGDLNIDHVLVFRATLTATRPTADHPIKAVHAYEVPSSSEWSFQKFSPVFHPNVFVDISKTLDLKIRAMARYESEAREFPHPRSPEAIRAVAQRWGSVAGVEAAEAFELVRHVY